MSTTRSVEDIDRTIVILRSTGRDDPAASARIDRLLEHRLELTREDGD